MITIIRDFRWGKGGGGQERNYVFLPSIREPCKQVNGVFDWCNIPLTEPFLSCFHGNPLRAGILSYLSQADPLLLAPTPRFFWNSIGIQHGGYACRNINAPKMQCRLLFSRRQTIVKHVFSYFRHKLAKDNALRGKVKFALFIFITLFDAKFHVTSHWLSNNSDGPSVEMRKTSIPPGKNHGFTVCFIWKLWRNIWVGTVNGKLNILQHRSNYPLWGKR